MPSVAYRVTRHLWSRWGNTSGLLGWLLSMSAAGCGAAIASAVGASTAAIVAFTVLGIFAFIFAVEALMFFTERYGSDNWNYAVAAWHHWVPMDDTERHYLTSLTYGDKPKRDGRLVRRWAHSGLSPTLLVTLAEAGLTDEDLRAYLEAPDGSDTRASLEMLAVLSNTPSSS